MILNQKNEILWLLWILVNKLDDESKQEQAKESAFIDFPTINEFKVFLYARFNELETRGNINIKKCCWLILKRNLSKQCYITSGIRCQNEVMFFLCMSSKHQANSCQSLRCCDVCNMKYHTSLHTETCNTRDNITHKPVFEEKLDSNKLVMPGAFYMATLPGINSNACGSYFTRSNIYNTRI